MNYKYFYIAFILMLIVAAIVCIVGIYFYVAEGNVVYCIMLEASSVVSVLLSWDNYKNYKELKDDNKLWEQ